jgi:hypothetical protein
MLSPTDPTAIMELMSAAISGFKMPPRTSTSEMPSSKALHGLPLQPTTGVGSREGYLVRNPLPSMPMPTPSGAALVPTMTHAGDPLVPTTIMCPYLQPLHTHGPAVGRTYGRVRVDAGTAPNARVPGALSAAPCLAVILYVIICRRLERVATHCGQRPFYAVCRSVTSIGAFR